MAIRIAADYRVSWGMVVTRLTDAGLIDVDQRRVLRRSTPTKAEFVALGLAPPPPDLEPPWVPRGVGVAVLKAYSARMISEDRARELLHGTLSELPPPELLSFDELTVDPEEL
jgi:hypothetical protein